MRNSSRRQVKKNEGGGGYGIETVEVWTKIECLLVSVKVALNLKLAGNLTFCEFTHFGIYGCRMLGAPQILKAIFYQKAPQDSPPFFAAKILTCM
jgi:hypothetical protein